MGPLCLYLDDERNPYVTEEPNTIELMKQLASIGARCVVAKNSTEFKAAITDEMPWIVSFDHDLGEINEDTNRETTGKDCAEWLCDYCLAEGLRLPEIYIHTNNPRGRENIDGTVKFYLKHKPELR